MKKTCEYCDLCDDHDYDNILHIIYCCYDGFIMRSPKHKCRFPNEFKPRKDPVKLKVYDYF